MEIRLLTDEQLRSAHRELLSEAFPPDELKPLRVLRKELETGRYHAWGLFDGEAMVGFAGTLAYAPTWRLFDYLCIAPEYRNAGLGAKLVEQLLEAERGNVLFGESEAPRFAADPALAERRIGFYRRCGAKDAGYDMALFGVIYRTLYWAERDIPPEEMMAQHRAVYHRRFAPAFYEKVIEIPWTREEPPAPLDWDQIEREYRENSGF